MLLHHTSGDARVNQNDRLVSNLSHIENLADFVFPADMLKRLHLTIGEFPHDCPEPGRLLENYDDYGRALLDGLADCQPWPCTHACDIPPLDF
jgi:hypothetical protein